MNFQPQGTICINLLEIIFIPLYKTGYQLWIRKQYTFQTFMFVLIELVINWKVQGTTKIGNERLVFKSFYLCQKHSTYCCGNWRPHRSCGVFTTVRCWGVSYRTVPVHSTTLCNNQRSPVHCVSVTGQWSWHREQKWAWVSGEQQSNRLFCELSYFYGKTV